MSRLEWWAVVVVAYLTVTAVVTVATGSEPRVLVCMKSAQS